MFDKDQTVESNLDPELMLQTTRIMGRVRMWQGVFGGGGHCLITAVPATKNVILSLSSSRLVSVPTCVPLLPTFAYIQPQGVLPKRC